MRTAAAYIRVSTREQDEYSPEAQKRLIFDYAKKNDMLISPNLIFEDIGISGTKSNKRPAFMNMIAMAKTKEHPIDVILVWKFSRFARNQEESIVYKSLLKKQNVDVISISESTPEGPFGTLIERIIEWMDEYYSIRLSGEVKRGMMQKAMDGGYNGAPPMGYEKPRGQSIPSVIEAEAKIIKRIYSLYVDDNMSISNIAFTLNKDGCKTRNGNKFERRIIKYILENPFYIGMIRFNYAPKARGRSKEGDVILRQGKHTPIISSTLFDAAQTKNKLNNDKYISDTRRPSAMAKHWLSGILKCSTCSSSLSFYKGARGKGSFNCYKHNKGICVDSSYISVTNAEKGVLLGLRNLVSSGSDFQFSIKPKQPNLGDDYDIIVEIDFIIDKLEKQMKRAKEAYLVGIDSLVEYKHNRIQIQKKIDEQNERKTLVSQEPVIIDYRMKLIDKINDVMTILENPLINIADKKEAIHSICSSIIYNRATDTLIFNLYIKEE